MRKFVLLLLVLLALPFSSFAAPVVSTEVSDYDFGQVSQGEKVTYTFRFRNSGDELLEISSVSSSCGCTAALLSSKRIAPGDMGEVKAIFDSSRFHGRVTKTITLKTNAPAQRTVLFHLSGEVKELLAISTSRIVWNWKTHGDVTHARVVISNLSDQTILLQPPRSTSPAITSALEKSEIAPGEKVTLSLSGSLPAGQQRLSGYILVNTNFKPMPQLRIAISGRLIK